MCFSSPKTPPLPEQKDPILPKQPLQAVQPASLQVGRVEGEDNKKMKQTRGAGRRKLRITKDAAGIQGGSSVGKASGLQVGGN